MRLGAIDMVENRWLGIVVVVIVGSTAATTAQSTTALERSAQVAAAIVAPGWQLQPSRLLLGRRHLHWARGAHKLVVTYWVAESEQEAAAQLRTQIEAVSVGGVQLESNLGDEAYGLHRYTPEGQCMLYLRTGRAVITIFGPEEAFVKRLARTLLNQLAQGEPAAPF
jgi:hypothetical protein